MVDPEIAFFRTNLLETLRNGPTLVTFTKKDMTTRVMECTLKPDMLPPAPVVSVAEEKEDKPARKKNENQCVVYDLEKQAWRSFTYDSVREYRAKDAA